MSKTFDWTIYISSLGVMVLYLITYFLAVNKILPDLHWILWAVFIVVGVISAFGIFFTFGATMAFMLEWWGRRK